MARSSIQNLLFLTLLGTAGPSFGPSQVTANESIATSSELTTEGSPADATTTEPAFGSIGKADQCEGGTNNFEPYFRGHPLNKYPMDTTINPLCTLEGMKADRTPYKSCVSGRGKMSDKPFTHCIGPSYHKVVHNAMALSSKCLNVEPDGLLSMFRAESSMNTNALSESGAAGFGQLFPSTVGYLNKQRAKILKQLKRHPSPECSNVLASTFEATSIPSGPPCAAALPPTRVVTNILYAFWHIREGERGMAQTIYEEASLRKLLPNQERIKGIESAQLRLAEQWKFLEKASRRRSTQKQVDDDVRTMAQLLKTKDALEQDRIEEIVKAIKGKTELRKLLRVSTIYGYNFGNNGFRGFLRMFLESDSFHKSGNANLDNLTGPDGKLSVWLRDNLPYIVSNRKKREELLNYIYTLAPGKRGSQSSIAQKAEIFHQLDSLAQPPREEESTERTKPCEPLF